MIQGNLSTNQIRLAKVTYVWPEANKLEVIFLDNGDYGRDIMVMSPYAGTDFGFTGGVPMPEEEGHENNITTDPNKRDIIAVIATLQGRHICLGYLYPQVTHMAFEKATHKNRLIERHTSDSYRTIDDDGNMEWVHPSGTCFLISEKDGPTDLEGKDYDARWEIKRNKTKRASITFSAGPNSITISDTGISIVGNITHIGDNTQFGAHLDGAGNVPHTA